MPVLPLAGGSHAKGPPAESPRAAGARLKTMRFSFVSFCKYVVNTELFSYGEKKKIPLVLHRVFEPAVRRGDV